jgi:hypothetical protein
MSERPPSMPSATDRKRSWVWRRVWATTCIGLFVGCGFLGWPAALYIVTLPVWVMAVREWLRR